MIKYFFVLIIIFFLIIYFTCYTYQKQKQKEKFETLNPRNYVLDKSNIQKTSTYIINSFYSNYYGTKFNTSIGNYFYIGVVNNIGYGKRIYLIQFINPITFPSQPQIRAWYSQYFNNINSARTQGGDVKYYKEMSSPTVYYHNKLSNSGEFKNNSVSWNTKNIKQIWIIGGAGGNTTMITIKNFKKVNLGIQEEKIVKQITPKLKTSLTNYINKNSSSIDNLKNSIDKEIQQVQNKLNSKTQGINKNSINNLQQELNELRDKVVSSNSLQNLLKSINLKLATIKNNTKSSSPLIQSEISDFKNNINTKIENEVKNQINQNINKSIDNLKNDIKNDLTKITISPLIIKGINAQILDLKNRVKSMPDKSDLDQRLKVLKQFIEKNGSSNPEIEKLINNFKNEMTQNLDKTKSMANKTLKDRLDKKLEVLKAQLQNQVQKFSLFVSRQQTSAILSPEAVRVINNSAKKVSELIEDKLKSIKTFSQPDFEALLNSYLEKIRDTYKKMNQQSPDFDSELAILQNTLNYEVKKNKNMIDQNLNQEVNKYSANLQQDLDKKIAEFNKKIVNKLSYVTVGSDITNKINSSVSKLQNLLQKQINSSQKTIDTKITAEIENEINKIKTELQNEMKQKNILGIDEILNNKFEILKKQVATDIQNIKTDLTTTLNNKLDKRVDLINKRIKFTLENQVNSTLENKKPELSKLVNNKIDMLGKNLMEDLQPVTPDTVADIQNSINKLKIDIQKNITQNNVSDLSDNITNKFNKIKSELSAKLSTASNEVESINPKTIKKIENDFDDYKSKLQNEIKNLKEEIAKEIKEQVSNITQDTIISKIEPKIKNNLNSKMTNDFQNIIDDKFKEYEEKIDISKQINSQINNMKNEVVQDIKPYVSKYLNSSEFYKKLQNDIEPDIFSSTRNSINSNIVSNIMPQVKSYYEPKIENRVKPFITSEVKKYSNN